MQIYPKSFIKSMPGCHAAVGFDCGGIASFLGDPPLRHEQLEVLGNVSGQELDEMGMLGAAVDREGLL
jgi:hypothetical protein